MRTAARSPKKASSCFAVRAVTTNHAAQHDISRVPRAQQRGLASTASTSGSANHDELPDLTLSPLQQASGKRCAGRSVLLTGGTSGIGLAIAKLLIAEGAGRVLIPTRNLDRGQKAIKDIVESLQVDEVPVSLLEADLSQDPSTLQIVTSAMRALVSHPLLSAGTTRCSHPSQAMRHPNLLRWHLPIPPHHPSDPFNNQHHPHHKPHNTHPPRPTIPPPLPTPPTTQTLQPQSLPTTTQIPRFHRHLLPPRHQIRQRRLHLRGLQSRAHRLYTHTRARSRRDLQEGPCQPGTAESERRGSRIR